MWLAFILRTPENHSIGIKRFFFEFFFRWMWIKLSVFAALFILNWEIFVKKSMQWPVQWPSWSVMAWCSDYHYYTTLFNKASTQVLRSFKSCSSRVGDLRWWELWQWFLLEIRLNVICRSTILQKKNNLSIDVNHHYLDIVKATRIWIYFVICKSTIKWKW